MRTKINLRYILKIEWIRVRGTNFKWPSSKTALFNVWRKRNPIQSIGKAERHLWCLSKSFPLLALFINDIPKVSTDEEYLYFLKPSGLILKEGPDSLWHSYHKEDSSFIQLQLKGWRTPFLSHQCNNTIPRTLVFPLVLSAASLTTIGRSYSS